MKTMKNYLSMMSSNMHSKIVHYLLHSKKDHCRLTLLTNITLTLMTMILLLRLGFPHGAIEYYMNPIKTCLKSGMVGPNSNSQTIDQL